MPGSKLSAPREMRFRWYRQVEQEGKTVDDVCRIFGMSRKTFYKWYRKDHGLDPGIQKPRRAHPMLKIEGHLRVALVEAKEKYNFGPKKMSIFLERETGTYVCPSAIYKFMKKRHLIRKPQKKQPWYTPLKEPFHAKTPGENVQLDVKYVPGFDGTWHYQFRFIDTVTNWQYATEAFSRDAQSSIYALHLAERSFPFEITGIQTDNGGEFRGAFHEVLLRRGIVQRYIPRRSAPWNGKVERANRSIDDEFYLNPTRPLSRLSDYVRWYNRERPHVGRGMNGLTPYQKFVSLSA